MFYIGILAYNLKCPYIAILKIIGETFEKNFISQIYLM